MKTLLLCAATAGLLLSGTAVNAETYDVSVFDFGYDPISLTIEVGDTVRWNNDGGIVHTVTGGADCTEDGSFDSGDIMPGESYELTFDSAGTFPYFCLYHCPTMEGEITVEEPTATEASSWGAIRMMYR
ncbi:MAG: hypothetical protein GF346_05505 [Candidatus Eisenbacteria bacterium]|nr:hypothetical protein [Candidatus Latescibacterota bacterium]MBD3301884.1 hypothetical protein [Candidatus Eisenbacteria bacterium]